MDAVIAPVLGENGKPKKYIGVRYDITEENPALKAIPVIMLTAEHGQENVAHITSLGVRD